MGNFEAVAEVGKNILRLSFAGEIKASDMPGYGETLKQALNGITPGFKLLVDLTPLVSMEFACAQSIREIMDLLNARGIKLIVRVLPDRTKDIGFTIMSLFHYPRGLKIITVDTIEEGERALR